MANGTLSFSGTGKGLSTNVPGLANLSTTWSVKWCQKVDTLRTLGAALATSSVAVGFLDSDGANSNHKCFIGWNVSNTGNINIKYHVFGGADVNGPVAAYTNLTANGTYVICEIDYVSGTQHFNVYTAAGVQIAALSGTAASVTNLPTGGSPGVFTLNKDNSGGLLQQANAYAGIAFYNVVLTGSQVFSLPLASDVGIQAGWYLNDAASGASPGTAAAFAGGAPLTLTNNTWLGDSSPWQTTPPPRQPAGQITQSVVRGSWW